MTEISTTEAERASGGAGSSEITAALAETAPPAQPTKSNADLYSLVAVSIFAAIGAALIPLAQYTCAMLLWDGSPLNIQPIPDDTQPVPSALLWNPFTYRLLTALGSLPLAAALTLYLFFAGCGAYCLIKAINPTFRLSTGVDWNSRILVRTYMHTAPLIKAFVTVVPVLVVIYLLWALVSGFVPRWIPDALPSTALVSAGLWLSLARSGFVGDCDSGNYLLPRAREALSLLFRGSLFGLIVWVAMYGLMAAPPERWIRLVRLLGGVGESAWRPAALAWLGSAAFAAALLCLGAIGLGRRSARGAVQSCVACLGAIGLAFWGNVWLPRYTAARFDADFVRSVPLEPTWWQRAGSEDGGIMLYLPTSGSGRVLRTLSHGFSGIPLNPAHLRRIRSHLKARGYRTALAPAAFAALYDRACLNGDPWLRVETAAEAVRHLGEPMFLRLLIEDLAIATGSPDRRRVRREAFKLFQRGGVIGFPTDDTRLPIGDLYAFAGDTADALRWYADAGLPAGRARERAEERRRGLQGRVAGTIVGAIDGLDPRAALAPAGSSVLASMTAPGRWRPIAPFALREIIRSARPDALGRFELNGIREGQYRLLYLIQAPRRGDIRELTITNDPRAALPIYIDTPGGTTDVGKLELQR